MKRRVGAGDSGFSMIEIVMALLIIAIVTTGALAFFINNLRSVNGQTQRQQAVNLANQQLETVQSLPVASLVTGRTQSAVNALYATAAATRLRISSQDDVSSSSNYDASGVTVPTVPTSFNKIVGGQTYTVYTFIDACYFAVDSGLCGPTSGSATTQEYRVSVDVAWTSTGNCTTGCDYSTSTLIDPSTNPTFNTNISAPAGNYDQVGSDSSPGINPKVNADNSLTDSCGGGVNGTKIVVTGTNFKSNIRVWISSGGGTIPASSVTQPIAGEVDFCYQTPETPGSYTISIINTDGGHFQLPITVIPDVISATGWDPVNKKLTLTGAGFQTGMVFTASGGATFTGTANQNYNNTSTADSVKLTGYVGTKDGNSTTITATTADGNYAGTFTIKAPTLACNVSPCTVASGWTRTNVQLSGSGFVSGNTTAVGVANGSVSNFSVSSATAATIDAAASGAPGQSQTFYVYNADGGFTSNASLTITTPMSITSASPATVTKATATTITVTGANFASGISAVTVANGTVSSVTFTSSTSIKLNGLTSTGTSPVTVTLKNLDGSQASLVINVPSITGLTGTPNPPVHSSSSQSWTVTGANFQSGATVVIKENTVALPVSNVVFVNSGKITFTATPQSNTGNRNFVVTVTNPAPDNSVATSSTFTISVA
ncbi:MAG: prepilin-type N-terminal cleavage/methylation domain-containing protein [Frankiaceae bacterium]|nr:prepilin-type N-terminal cleavage/methylation domain-containing protein [Frankiaceae bacterium]